MSTNKYIPTLRIFTQFLTGVVLLQYIEYNPDYFTSLSHNGKLLVLYHEYIHGFLTYQNQSYDHNALIKDPVYMQGVKDIYPGMSDDFYNKMKYAGCVDATEYKALSDSEREKIKALINGQIKKSTNNN